MIRDERELTFSETRKTSSFWSKNMLKIFHTVRDSSRVRRSTKKNRNFFLVKIGDIFGTLAVLEKSV
jgi:hypothetical protein